MKATLSYYIYRLSNILYKARVPLIPFIIQQILRFVFCCIIPYQTTIGKNVHFTFNGLGIVTHKRGVIGNNVWISQYVTLGGRESEGVPVIGDNVYIGAGVKVLGGERSVIMQKSKLMQW